MNVLLVEPDKVLARTYAAALTGAGHVVRTANMAQAAIHRADEQLPDVVLLEVQLVSHSGIEFLYEFRSYADWQQVPVIIHSNVPPGEFADAQPVLKGLLGVQEIHYKPRTTLQKLLNLVQNAGPDTTVA